MSGTLGDNSQFWDHTLGGRVTNQRIFGREGREKVEALETTRWRTAGRHEGVLRERNLGREHKSCLQNYEEGIDWPALTYSLQSVSGSFTGEDFSSTEWLHSCYQNQLREENCAGQWNPIVEAFMQNSTIPLSRNAMQETESQTK